MLTWNKEIIINAPIETVWKLFDLDQIQRIMPNIVENKPLNIKEGVVGSTYETDISRREKNANVYRNRP